MSTQPNESPAEARLPSSNSKHDVCDNNHGSEYRINSYGSSIAPTNAEYEVADASVQVVADDLTLAQDSALNQPRSDRFTACQDSGEIDIDEDARSKERRAMWDRAEREWQNPDMEAMKKQFSWLSTSSIKQWKK